MTQKLLKYEVQCCSDFTELTTKIGQNRLITLTNLRGVTKSRSFLNVGLQETLLHTVFQGPASFPVAEFLSVLPHIVLYLSTQEAEGK